MLQKVILTHINNPFWVNFNLYNKRDPRVIEQNESGSKDFVVKMRALKIKMVKTSMQSWQRTTASNF